MSMKLKKSEIIKAIRDTYGVKTEMARRLGVVNQTIYNYLKRWPELEEEVVKAREQIVDLAETKLIDLIRQGDKTAIIFTLKTLGKNRGYVENPNIAIQNNVLTSYVMPDPEYGGSDD